MTIGNDFSYLLEVLATADGETEDQWDERLKTEAKELGVEVGSQEATEGQNGTTSRPQLHSECSRRSDSMDSRASHSTGLTSNYSDLSKDHSQYHGYRKPSRASLSFRDYDAFLARGVPNGRHSISFSPLTTPSQSTFSLPLSQPTSLEATPKRHFRRIRGLSLLRLHQRIGSDSSLAEGCPHCPQSVTSQRRAVHKLPCGHRLCTQALRNTIRTAIESRKGAVPSCCGRPVPGILVEHVMTQEEQNALLDKLEQWDEAVSITPSVTSSRRESVPSSPPQRRPGQVTSRSRTVSDQSPIDSLPPQMRQDVERVMAREDYRLLRVGQSDQRDRFLSWVAQARAELIDKHERLREESKMHHEVVAEDLAEHHASAISEAEDKQVKAESDLRESHAHEKRDNATALKYMEAYCAGTYNNGEPHNRTVTEPDFAELDKTQRMRDQMDAKHASQINVLRGEQGRRMRLRVLRQERELQELKRQQRQEELALERACTSETLKLDESLAEKRRKIRWRWELQMAIFAKKVEAEMSIRLECRLTTADWYPRHDSAATQVAARTLGESDSKGISTGFAMRGVTHTQ